MAPGSRDSAVSVTWGHLFYWASVSVLATPLAGREEEAVVRRCSAEESQGSGE